MNKEKEVKEVKTESSKILRVKSFVFHVGDEEYKLPETPNSEYVVDDSSFIPISEAIKQLGNGSSAAGKADLMYDFPDGKDNGMEIPFSRSSQFKDIAELSSNVADKVDDINQKLESQKREEEFKKQVEKDLAPPAAE